MKSAPIICRFLVAALVLSFILQPAACAASDLAKDHWAIQSLIDGGILEIDEDDKFVGSELVDYSMFIITLANLLEKIDTATIKATGEDYQLLKEISNEFRKDLAELFAKTGEIEEELLHSIKEGIAVDERVNNLVEKLFEIEKIISRIEVNLMEESNATTKLLEWLEQQKAILEEHSQLLQQQATGLDEVQTEGIKKLQKALESLDENLEYVQTEIERRFNNEMAEMKGAVDLNLDLLKTNIWEQIDLLQAQLTDLRQDVEANVVNIDKLLKTLLEAEKSFIDYQIKMDKDWAALTGVVEDTEKDVVVLSGKIESEIRKRKADTALLEEELAFLKTQVGVSEEELEQLTKELEERVLVDLNIALREKNVLANALDDLKHDFENYKAKTDKEVKAAKSLGTIGIAVGTIGVLVAVFNFW